MEVTAYIVVCVHVFSVKNNPVNNVYKPQTSIKKTRKEQKEIIICRYNNIFKSL